MRLIRNHLSTHGNTWEGQDFTLSTSNLPAITWGFKQQAAGMSGDPEHPWDGCMAHQSVTCCSQVPHRIYQGIWQESQPQLPFCHQVLAQLAVKPLWQCQWKPATTSSPPATMEVSLPPTQNAVPGSKEDRNYKDTAWLHGGIQQTSKPTGKNKNIGLYPWGAKHEPQNQHVSPWVPSHPCWNCSV